MKSKLYTRRGDDGTTSLVGGTRVLKDSPRLQAYGTVDELNSWLGLLAASDAITSDARDTLRSIQHRLFDIGAALATEPESAWQPQLPGEKAITALEKAIDAVDATLPPLRQFVLPGGHPDAARANVARTVARRAERAIITLSQTTAVDPVILQYINRLSDFLFALSRQININANIDEIFWQKDC